MIAIELKSGTVLSWPDLVVQGAFSVVLVLPCSEAGMAVYPPEHHSYKLRTTEHGYYIVVSGACFGLHRQLRLGASAATAAFRLASIS